MKERGRVNPVSTSTIKGLLRPVQKPGVYFLCAFFTPVKKCGGLLFQYITQFCINTAGAQMLFIQYLPGGLLWIAKH